MEKPTPQQVEAMMIEKIGALPKSLIAAKEVDPEFLVDQAILSQMNSQNEANPFDPKTSSLISLAASLTLKSEECVVLEMSKLKKMGITKEELAFLVRIVKLAHANAVMSSAGAAFETFES